MEDVWLDRFDLGTPSLTRASSANSVDEGLQEREMDALADGSSRMTVFDGTEDVYEWTGDWKHVAQGSSAPLVDEPECYECSESQTVFNEHKNTFVSSPEAATFPSLDYSLPLVEANLETQIAYAMPMDGLVSSPVSTIFPARSSLRRIGSSSVLQESIRESRRKALLIGIRYYRNPRFKGLKGPHHDVRELQRLLQDVYGWSSGCFRVLKDDNTSARNQPTLENIKYEIKQLVEDAHPEDHLFFYFSGHGGQIPDTDGDEEDGMDEVIVSCDGKILVDDELHDILVKPLPAGCHLTALLDCCSSGTSLDLPYNAVTACDSVQQTRSATWKHSEGNVVLLSACADAERAYENQDQEDENKRVRGMLTKAFIDSLKTRKNSTYDELLTSVRSLLKRRDTMQNPQLSSSRVIDMDDYFDL